MLSSKSNERIEIENKVDNYIRNIQVLIALSTIFRNYNGTSVIGKKLTLVQEDGYITPDLVTEIKDKSAGYGILCESKVSLSKEQVYWKEHFEQLKRYDKELRGWVSRIQNHDLIFVTDGILTKKFFEYIKNMSKSQNYQFAHKLAILYSHREDKVNSFIDLKREYGDRLSLLDLSNNLDYGVRIPLKNIIRDIEDIKFYDDRPHFIYTMETMWNFVFPSKIPIENYIRQTANSAIPLEVNIDSLLEEMRMRFAPSSNPTVIERDWIKEALDRFVEIGLAEKIEQNNNYEVYFRKLRRTDSSTRNYLLNLFFKPKPKRKEKEVDLDQTRLDKFIS